ncbi:MAG: lysine biosynthesis protein LysX [Candidatus Geothermarchaeales archaeon]
MRLTIICSRIGWEEKALLNELRDRDVETEILDIRKTVFSLTNGEGGLHSDLFLQRSVSYLRGLYTTAILENLGYPVINSFESSQICGNKLLTTLRFANAKIPTPRTLISFTKESSLRALDELGYPSIIKPIIGGWGRLVAPLKDPQSAKAILEDREELGNPFHKVFYLQEYIPKSRDIRALVVGESVAAAMYRYDVPDDWRSSATRGARVERCEVTPEIEQLSLRAAKAVGGEVLGVDLIEGSDGLLVNEINHTPQFRGISSTGANIVGEIVDYLIERMRR